MSNKLLDKLGLTSLITKITNTFAKKQEINSLKSVLSVATTETNGHFIIGQKNFGTTGQDTTSSDLLICFGKIDKILLKENYESGQYTSSDATSFSGTDLFGGNQILLGISTSNEYNYVPPPPSSLDPSGTVFTMPIEIIPEYTTVDNQRRYDKFYAVAASNDAANMKGYYIAIIGKLTN